MTQPEEFAEMMSVLCSMFDMVNQTVMKNHKGPGLPDGGWKVLKQGVHDGGIPYIIVMRRDDGKKFHIQVSDATKFRGELF